MTTVTAHQARRNFGELIELAFYKNAQIRIERNKRPMVRLVGEPLMAALDKLLHEDPALAETLEIMLDDEATNAINQSRIEWQAGKKIPISKAFK